MRDTYWVDRTGQPMKVYNEMLGIESFLTTREVARDTRGLAQLDFNRDLAVPVDRPLASPHATRRVRYRLRLDRGDPAAAFVSGPSQQVKSIDAHTAEVTVYALRPGQPGADADASDDAPGEEDRRPNSIIQSDNPKIAALARKIAGEEKDLWQKAVALERFVQGYVALKGFSQGFATAGDVVESREGDCTEHAVLLAALCRAAGIPARVAVGLVYQDQKFLFHMWTEVYVGKRWTPIDATLARGGIGAAHLKLAHSSLQGGSAFGAALSVANVLARGLKVEVIEVE
jgi:transglutaminase-like putative cysteine protease